MKRLLAVLALVLAVSATPGTASAGVSCRNQIYNDWYKDGKIASTYPVGCYRSALKHVHGDAAVYSSLIDDIRAAMQAAISRQAGKHVPAQVGKGVPKATSSDDVLVDAKGGTKIGYHRSTTPTATPGNTSTLAAPPVADSGSGGIPVPLLVLGGLAVALTAAGGLGALARKRSG